MPAPDPSTSAIASLTERELEILDLLTAGHTVKSIAVRLGRSETSINERLREARRKTGIGSSRELARLISAQKNRDEKIDLGTAPALTASGALPGQNGLHSSKGAIVMLIALSLAAAGLIAVAAEPPGGDASAQQVEVATAKASPLVGRWALDTARIPAAERPRQVVIAFRLTEDGKWNTVVEMVAANGASSRAESTASTDGVPVPVSGNMSFIDTVALRQPAPNSLVMTLGKNGAPVSTRVYTSAKDRRTMTETIVWAGSAMPQLETTWFNRID